MAITPVILCGGSGTRLWPLSRKSYPKQFAKLIGEESLFQQSALRVHGEAFDRPVILTNSDFRFIVAEQLTEIGVDPKSVLIEPEGRNTAPAILAAALHLSRTVSRRAERLAVALAGEEEVNENAVKYLNRLSDWFFVASRVANENGSQDVLWVPGANR